MVSRVKEQRAEEQSVTWDLRSRSQQAGAVILMVVPVRAASVAQSSWFMPSVKPDDGGAWVPVVWIQWRVGSGEGRQEGAQMETWVAGCSRPQFDKSSKDMHVDWTPGEWWRIGVDSSGNPPTIFQRPPLWRKVVCSQCERGPVTFTVLESIQKPTEGTEGRALDLESWAST